MKNINSQVLRKTSAVRFTLARFTLARFVLVRFTLVRFTLARFVLAAILIPALLIGSAFTFGDSKLQAQANGSSKLGFFAGFVYLNGFKVDSSTKTTRVTNAINSIADATRTSYKFIGYSPIITTSSIDVKFIHLNYINNVKLGIAKVVVANCETGATTDGKYSLTRTNLNSFDVGTSDSVTKTDSSGAPFLTSNACKNHLDTITLLDNFTVTTDDIVRGSITTTTPQTTASTPTNESDKLSGIGLQFGFRWEKWRASLTHFTGKGGANELANTLVMADYFVNKDFFVGGGLASMKLTNSTNGSTSESAISPAIQIGYKQNLTSNLSLNFGLTKYISGVSLKNSTAPTNTSYISAPDLNLEGPTTSGSTTQKEETLIFIGHREVQFELEGGGKKNYSVYRINESQDFRASVTQVKSRPVDFEKTIETGTETTTEETTETTTETDAELKAPLVISISFHLSF